MSTPAASSASVATSRTQSSSSASSGSVTISGIMISTCGSPPAALARHRRLEDRLGLHPVQAGLDDPEAAAAGAEHRVGLPPELRGGEELAALGVELAPARRATSSSSTSGRNSCSGGSSRRMVTGRPSIASRMPTKSLRWSVSSSASAALSSDSSSARMIRCTSGQAVAEEHVLGAAEADALGAEAPRHLRVLGQVGVGAHLHPAEAVGPAEQDRRTARPGRV